ncbi:hypothetical protein PIB30_060722 [Stylosanthes scabra]|uniref:Uncharacterized protein n=1 Tax=Stylosanthes scabra TaxID=79078 RepID=A0ABU6YK24_9FABA|nr:hypothetical protein [Stylosanthes scabra]
MDDSPWNIVKLPQSQLGRSVDSRISEHFELAKFAIPDLQQVHGDAVMSSPFAETRRFSKDSTIDHVVGIVLAGVRVDDDRVERRCDKLKKQRRHPLLSFNQGCSSLGMS